MMIAGIPTRARSAAVWLVMLAAFVAYVAIFLRYLPDAHGRGGPDYAYFLPQLLAGYFWYAHNGLWSLPWFTPAFCAGMPFYPNMQAMYFSLPQFLTFAVGPTLAISLTFLVFAGAGLAGTYALLRVRYRTSQWAAATGAILFLFNAFFAFRMLAGHLTFHAFMLAPLVAYGVLGGSEKSALWRNCFDLGVIGATFLIGYMVQSGMVHALPPSICAIAVFILIYALLFDSSPLVPFLRLVTACVLALLLDAAKLTAALAFLNQFPRTMLPMMGFDSFAHTFVIAFKALFFAPPLADEYAWLRNNEWYPGLHVILAFQELAYSVTIVPLVIMVSAAPWVVKLFPAARKDPRRFAGKLLLIAATLAILVIPIVLNWYTPGWAAFLKSIPIIKSSSTLTRWFCLYVLVSILVTALILDRFTLMKPFVVYAAVATLVVAVGTDAILARAYTGSAYYTQKRYNFTKMERAYRLARRTGKIPVVSRIDWAKLAVKAPWSTRRDRNDSLATGGSQAICYEPMFGHRLEQYPFGKLRPGCVFRLGQDSANIKNPACMLFPKANRCRPGDQFGAGDLDRARRFVSYRPFRFVMPWYQHVADVVNLVTLLAMLAAVAVFVFRERTGKGSRRPATRRPPGG